jgi:Cohesin domain
MFGQAVEIMRKTAITLAVLTVAANAAEISLEQGTVAPGKSVALNVKMSAAADAPTGLQFDLEYDAAALDITVDPGSTAQQASKNVRTAPIQPGKLRVLIIGFNRTTISDGVLAIVHVTSKGAETGKTFPLHITGASGTNANAEKVAVTAKDGGVKVEK